MKKILILCIAIILILGYACKKHKPASMNVGDNSIEELPWLKDTIRSFSKYATESCPANMIQFSAAGQIYFLQVINGPACDGIPIIYDYTGKVICGYYPQAKPCEALIDSSFKNGKVIWKMP